MVREHPSEHPLIGSAPNGLEAQNNAHAHTHTYAIVHTHTHKARTQTREPAGGEEGSGTEAGRHIRDSEPE